MIIKYAWSVDFKKKKKSFLGLGPPHTLILWPWQLTKAFWAPSLNEEWVIIPSIGGSYGNWLSGSVDGLFLESLAHVRGHPGC